MDNPSRVDDVAASPGPSVPDPQDQLPARADERHAMRLYATGVTEAVPETIESSLQRGEAFWWKTGVPWGW